MQVFVEEATNLDAAANVEEETYEDLKEKFPHKKFRLAAFKENKNNESVPNKDKEVLESRGEIRASPQKKKIDDGQIYVSSASKRSTQDNSNEKGDQREEKESKSMRDKTAIPQNKRKRKPNKQNGVQSRNSKKIRLEKVQEPTNSDTEIDLPGEPIFIPAPENLSDLDDSYDESVLVVDLKESPKVEEANTTKFMDNSSQDLNSQLEIEDNKQKPARRKVNTRFSDEQTAGLRKAFKENSFVSREKAQMLSKELCLTEKQVKNWFNWYRAKLAKTRVDKLTGEGETMDVKNGSDEDYNEDDVNPLGGGVRVKYDMANISRINDIADIKEAKSQSGELSTTSNAKSKTYWYDLLMTNAASPNEESNKSSSAPTTASLTDVTENYANYTPPTKSKTNPDNDFNKSVTKRSITRYSEHQKETLGKAFEESNFLMKGQAEELSQELCLTEKQVKDWFKGQRRSKARKDKAKLVGKTEQHLEETEEKDEDSECAFSTDDIGNEGKKDEDETEINGGSDQSGEKEIDNAKNYFQCECGETFKNPLVLKFHKNDSCVA